MRSSDVVLNLPLEWCVACALQSQCLSSLRPGMGHPSQLAALSDLDQKQSSTHEMATSAVSMHADSLKVCADQRTLLRAKLVVASCLPHAGQCHE